MDLLWKLTKVRKDMTVFQHIKSFWTKRNVSETVNLFAHLEKIFSSFAVNGEAEHLDFIDSSMTEEEEEEIRMDPPTPPVTAPPLVIAIHGVIVSDPLVTQRLAWFVTKNREVIDCVIDFQEQKESSSPPQTQDSVVFR